MGWDHLAAGVLAMIGRNSYPPFVSMTEADSGACIQHGETFRPIEALVFRI